jgi:RimJ/RimL family protein N-acetyltransferase
MNIEPVTLEGAHVRLEPLSLAHCEGLAEVGLDESVWRWNPTPVQTMEGMRAYIEEALAWQARGGALPFATIEKSSGRAIGSTRYANIDETHRRLEIGWTWIAPHWQRTAINTEAKYLMLRHAFENLGCIRVELKTDSLNERSRNAILRIGAKEEGTFRNHMITSTGRIRHSVFFSITDFEWAEVKANLEVKLARSMSTRP